MKFLPRLFQRNDGESMDSHDRLNCCKRKLTGGTVLTAVVLISLFGMLVAGNAASEWNVPEADRAKENPQEVTEESLEKGKTIYDQNCLFCHGESGAGDGQVAAMLSTKPTRFDAAEHMDEETDGESFWKISTGKEPMPGFAKKLSAEDIWHTINYLRSFPKKKEK